ncbi:hypothetical protein BDR03DRAFT_626400 [Suillus americanus]|nr:hypothetical protein BDR03DRAFT_626400 [Suillus americanus]
MLGISQWSFLARTRSSWEDVYQLFLHNYCVFNAIFLSKSQYTDSVINVTSVSGTTCTTQRYYKYYNVSRATAIHLSTYLRKKFRRKAVQVRANIWHLGIYLLK